MKVKKKGSFLRDFDDKISAKLPEEVVEKKKIVIKVDTSDSPPTRRVVAVQPEVVEEVEVEEVEEVVEATEVVGEVESEVPSEPVRIANNRNRSASRKPKNQEITTYAKLPRNHGARFVKRDDVPAENYWETAKVSTYGIFDSELYSWLSNFSKENQEKGGAPLPAGFIIEIVLGMLKYDLDIQPEGFDSKGSFIAELKRKLDLY